MKKILLILLTLILNVPTLAGITGKFDTVVTKDLIYGENKNKWSMITTAPLAIPSSRPSSPFVYGTYPNDTLVVVWSCSTDFTVMSKTGDLITWSTITLPIKRNSYNSVFGKVAEYFKGNMYLACSDTIYRSQDFFNTSLSIDTIPFKGMDTKLYSSGDYLYTRYTAVFRTSDGTTFNKIGLSSFDIGGNNYQNSFAIYGDTLYLSSQRNFITVFDSNTTYNLSLPYSGMTATNVSSYSGGIYISGYYGLPIYKNGFLATYDGKEFNTISTTLKSFPIIGYSFNNMWFGAYDEGALYPSIDSVCMWSYNGRDIVGEYKPSDFTNYGYGSTAAVMSMCGWRNNLLVFGQTSGYETDKQNMPIWVRNFSSSEYINKDKKFGGYLDYTDLLNYDFTNKISHNQLIDKGVFSHDSIENYLTGLTNKTDLIHESNTGLKRIVISPYDESGMHPWQPDYKCYGYGITGQYIVDDNLFTADEIYAIKYDDDSTFNVTIPGYYPEVGGESSISFVSDANYMDITFTAVSENYGTFVQKTTWRLTPDGDGVFKLGFETNRDEVQNYLIYIDSIKINYAMGFSESTLYRAKINYLSSDTANIADLTSNKLTTSIVSTDKITLSNPSSFMWSLYASPAPAAPVSDIGFANYSYGTGYRWFDIQMTRFNGSTLSITSAIVNQFPQNPSASTTIFTLLKSANNSNNWTPVLNINTNYPGFSSITIAHGAAAYLRTVVINTTLKLEGEASYKLVCKTLTPNANYISFISCNLYAKLED